MEKYAEKNDFPIIRARLWILLLSTGAHVECKIHIRVGIGLWLLHSLVRQSSDGKWRRGGASYVWDEELSKSAVGHLSVLGRGDVVQYHIAEAVETLRQTEGPFDIIFNDIDKDAYPSSLPVIKEKLRSGGVLIIDNMLWSGRVFDSKNHDKSTDAIRLFTRDITTDAIGSYLSLPMPRWHDRCV
jgi:hypothetical protein